MTRLAISPPASELEALTFPSYVLRTDTFLPGIFCLFPYLRFSRLFIAFFDMPSEPEGRTALSCALGRLLAPALYLPTQMSDARRLIVASGLLQGILLRRRRSPLPRRRSLRRSPLPRWRLPRRSPLPRRRSLLSVFLRLLVLGVRLHLGGARWSLGWTLG